MNCKNFNLRADVKERFRLHKMQPVALSERQTKRKHAVRAEFISSNQLSKQENGSRLSILKDKKGQPRSVMTYDEVVSEKLGRTMCRGVCDEDEEPFSDDLYKINMYTCVRDDIEIAERLAEVDQKIFSVQESKNEADKCTLQNPNLLRCRTSSLQGDSESNFGKCASLANQEKNGAVSSSTEDRNLQAAAYTLGDHEDFLHLSTEKERWRYCDLGPILGVSSVANVIKDYLSPLPPNQLRLLYFGVESAFASDLAPTQPEPLPVRTLVIRVRPDISSETIMDAVQSAFSGETCSVLLKCQESRACWEMVYGTFAYVIDTQLCIARTERLERCLIVRVYHEQSDHTMKQRKISKLKSHHGRHRKELETSDYYEMTVSTHLHLRQACSLVQMLQSGIVSSYSPSPKPTPTATSAHFMYNYESSPSVRDSRSTFPQQIRAGHGSKDIFPALSKEDWPLLQASEGICVRIWRALSTRDCSFETVVAISLLENSLDDGRCRYALEEEKK